MRDDLVVVAAVELRADRLRELAAAASRPDPTPR